MVDDASDCMTSLIVARAMSPLLSVTVDLTDILVPKASRESRLQWLNYVANPEEFGRGQVLQTRMRAHLVVVSTPVLDHDLRFNPIAKPLRR